MYNPRNFLRVASRYLISTAIPSPNTYIKIDGKTYIVSRSWEISQGTSYERGHRGYMEASPINKHGVAQGSRKDFYMGKTGVWYYHKGNRLSPVVVQNLNPLPLVDYLQAFKKDTNLKSVLKKVLSTVRPEDLTTFAFELLEEINWGSVLQKLNLPTNRDVSYPSNFPGEISHQLGHGIEEAGMIVLGIFLKLKMNASIVILNGLINQAIYSSGNDYADQYFQYRMF